MRLWLHLDLRRPQPFFNPAIRSVYQVDFSRNLVLKWYRGHYAIFSGGLFMNMHCSSLIQCLLPIRESLCFPKMANSFLLENISGNWENRWRR